MPRAGEEVLSLGSTGKTLLPLTHPLLLLFSPSVVSDSVTPWTAAGQASLSFTISLSLLKIHAH